MLCCMLWLCWNDEWLSELCVHPLVISESATELPPRTADRPTSRARAPTVGDCRAAENCRAAGDRRAVETAGSRETAGSWETAESSETAESWRLPSRVRLPSRGDCRVE